MSTGEITLPVLTPTTGNPINLNLVSDWSEDPASDSCNAGRHIFRYLPSTQSYTYEGRVDCLDKEYKTCRLNDLLADFAMMTLDHYYQIYDGIMPERDAKVAIVYEELAEKRGSYKLNEEELILIYECATISKKFWVKQGKEYGRDCFGLHTVELVRLVLDEEMDEVKGQWDGPLNSFTPWALEAFGEVEWVRKGGLETSTEAWANLMERGYYRDVVVFVMKEDLEAMTPADADMVTAEDEEAVTPEEIVNNQEKEENVRSEEESIAPKEMESAEEDYCEVLEELDVVGFSDNAPSNEEDFDVGVKEGAKIMKRFQGRAISSATLEAPTTYQSKLYREDSGYSSDISEQLENLKIANNEPQQELNIPEQALDSIITPTSSEPTTLPSPQLQSTFLTLTSSQPPPTISTRNNPNIVEAAQQSFISLTQPFQTSPPQPLRKKELLQRARNMISRYDLQDYLLKYLEETCEELDEQGELNKFEKLLDELTEELDLGSDVICRFLGPGWKVSWA